MLLPLSPTHGASQPWCQKMGIVHSSKPENQIKIVYRLFNASLLHLDLMLQAWLLLKHLLQELFVLRLRGGID